MVERIQRAIREFEIALCIDVVEYPPGDHRKILERNVIVDHYNQLCVHELAHAPEKMHNLARLAGVALADRDEHAVMEDAFERHVDVRNLRAELLKEGQKEPFGRLGKETVFFGRNADDGGRVNRGFTPRHPLEMENRVVVGQGIEARMVAEGPF